ncbi:peptidase family S66 [Elsinoe ampelina]|uniref:Peptidase family S66 n=1 Tax=Elsinoe ampelina TaxID=302913 RepID=A0A6A6G7H4_9PEZI|nr:peptidase family S66 [Elsinoe ampelina]
MVEVKLKPLTPGGTIAFLSPSSRLNKLFGHRIERAKGFFARNGFHVKVFWQHTLSSNYHEAVLQRCEELHAAFLDPEVSAIVCTIGGHSCNELLEYIDYDVVRLHPKVFCGFSDISLLHQAFYTQAGLQTFYGPAVIPNFGEHPEPMPFTFETFQSALCGFTGPVPRSLGWSQEWLDWLNPSTDQEERSLAPSPPWKWLRAGHAQAKLLGGCLPSLNQLVGSKYCPDYNGCVLLLETPEADHRPDAPMSLDMVRKSLTDLRNAGVLGEISGLVVGRPFMYDDNLRAEFHGVVLEACQNNSYPILVDIDIGHTHPTLTLPLGSIVILDAGRDTFGILDSPVATLKEI